MTTGTMEHADLILALDKQQQADLEQGVNAVGPVYCEVKEHGRLLPLRDGVRLACCKCGYIAPAILKKD